MRIGHGYDVHRFGEGDFITLGGVRIPHRFGLLAHSDGDVLLHALSDALLGAAALGDIGKHFPDTDPQFKGADSRVLLRHVLEQVKSKGWKVGNVDATIIAQAPKMASHIEAMRGLDLDTLQTRSDADEALRGAVRSRMVRSFLLQSLVRDGGDGWRWRLNLEALARDLGHLRGFPEPPPGTPIRRGMLVDVLA